MGFNPMPRRNFMPTSSEVVAWRELATLAQEIALGQSRRWQHLKSLAHGARKLTVFGPNGHGNVCVLLIEKVVAATESVDPHRHYPELDRLACEVLKRCNGWAVCRLGEIGRG